ncbi:SDR family oxidoreductase [Emticicia sp. BO119]|uniref:SDR family oxidoreductase n=1 Tax=Emticicia sp. BO119 TaxID=2757768 RepID=UPI0015F02E7E|nr:NmrA family NAD(P)-binding protein [Emticicia sp. BO119]MBA4850649.1 NmrA family NAD(P)-binding protein [Emticicia sp. BO119]
MQSILITGGTGTLGQELSKQLLAKGYSVNILSSKEKPEIAFFTNIIQGDLTDQSSLEKAVESSEIIIHCASNPRNAQVVDIEGTRNLLALIDKNHCKHFLYVSIAGVDKSDYPYYQTKYAVEKLIEASELPYSILRATQFHDLVLYRLIQVFDQGPGKPIQIPAGMKFQSIDKSDTATSVIELVANKPTYTITTIGGPEVLTLENMTEDYFAQSGRNEEIVYIEPSTAFYQVFTTGINLCPENAIKGITWQQYLSNLQLQEVTTPSENKSGL